MQSSNWLAKARQQSIVFISHIDERVGRHCQNARLRPLRWSRCHARRFRRTSQSPSSHTHVFSYQFPESNIDQTTSYRDLNPDRYFCIKQLPRQIGQIPTSCPESRLFFSIEILRKLKGLLQALNKPFAYLILFFDSDLSSRSCARSFRPTLSSRRFTPFRSPFDPALWSRCPLVPSFGPVLSSVLLPRPFASSFRPVLSPCPFIPCFRLVLSSRAFVPCFRLVLSSRAFIPRFRLKLSSRAFISSFRLDSFLHLVSRFRLDSGKRSRDLCLKIRD